MDITQEPARYGDSENTLLLKIATLVQAGHGVDSDPLASYLTPDSAFYYVSPDGSEYYQQP